MCCALNGWLLDSQALIVLKDDFSFLFSFYNSIIFCLCGPFELVLEVYMVVCFGFVVSYRILIILGKLCSLMLQFDCKSVSSFCSLLVIFGHQDLLLVVEVIELLGQLLFQSMALNIELQNFWLCGVVSSQVDEVLDLSEIALQRLLTERTKMGARPPTIASSIAFTIILKGFLNVCTNLFLVFQPLIVDTFPKELIKIEVIRHQEVDITRIELQSTLSHYTRGRKHIKIEWPNRILHIASVPLVSGHADLKGIHTLTAMLDLLILVFNCIIVISFIVVANAQSRELGVECDEICSRQ
jgi:hypothetical protein